MLKQMLDEKNLPVLKQRSEMLDILMKEEYGYMPSMEDLSVYECVACSL